MLEKILKKQFVSIKGVRRKKNRLNRFIMENIKEIEGMRGNERNG